MKPSPLSLSRKYDAHGKVFEKIEFRAVKLDDYLSIGEVSEVQPNGSKGLMVIEILPAIAEYIERLVIEPGYECLNDLDLNDQIALKDHIKDFFQQARRALDTKGESLSLDSGNPPRKLDK